MKFVYYGNTLNYQTKPLADALYGIMGEDFAFILDDHRLINNQRNSQNDRGDMTETTVYAYNMAISDSTRRKCIELIDECDVLYTLACFCKKFNNRVKDNKVTIFYSERFFKPANLPFYNPRLIASQLWYNRRYINKRSYMFCVSGYLPVDLSIYNSYKNKMYKWGYFAYTDDVSWEELEKCKLHDTVQIAWLGFITKDNNWKHFEKMIPLAEEIKKKQINAIIQVMGDGDARADFEKLIQEKNLASVFDFKGYLRNDDLRIAMRSANIFVGTSDYQEGWGVVLNDAMNDGCVAVNSHAAGSSPYMINDGQNGFVFEGSEYSDSSELVDIVIGLCRDRERIGKIGKAAYESYRANWSAEEGARRLLEFCEDAIANDSVITFDKYVEGPCSIAKVIRQNQMYEAIKCGKV